MDLISISNADLVNLYNKRTLISSINLHIEDGDIVLLSGTNGSGKSTLIKALFGNQFTEENYAKLHNSEISFLEKKNLSDLHEYTEFCIYIDQNIEPGKVNRTVEKILLESIPESIKNKKEYFENFLEKYIILTNEDKEGEFDFKKKKQTKPFLKRPYYSLSGGQKKWVCILQGLIKVDVPSIKVAFIDEPLNNLDAKRIKQFSDIMLRIKYIKRQNLENFAFVIVSHCKAFPRITKLYEIENLILEDKSHEINKIENCKSCFGQSDELGFYDCKYNPEK